jgi:hypothetical protein
VRPLKFVSWKHHWLSWRMPAGEGEAGARPDPSERPSLTRRRHHLRLADQSSSCLSNDRCGAAQPPGLPSPSARSLFLSWLGPILPREGGRVCCHALPSNHGDLYPLEGG